MLQNKLLSFYFELILKVRRMENISLTEICRLLASCCAVAISTPIMGRIRASCQPRGLWPEAKPSGLCMCPLYCGQVMDRCACSGGSCLNPFYDMFMTHLCKGEGEWGRGAINMLIVPEPVISFYFSDICLKLGFLKYFISQSNRKYDQNQQSNIFF